MKKKINYFQTMKSTSLVNKKVIFTTLSCIVIVTYLILPQPKRVHPNDYNQLIDIPFKFLHIPECKEKNNFLILVHTSPDNIDRRNILRESWANKNESDIDIFFLTGIPNTRPDQEKLEKEINEYKNFIQGDFLDTYRNLTYKHVMGLKYIFYHCPNIQYIIKIDDDVFVNISILKTFFRMYSESFGHTKNILCTTRIGHPVLRDGKWAVTTNEYPESTYPPHCPGFAFIYPQTAIELLYPVVQKIKYFWIDDIHVTGTTAKDAGVGHVDISHLTMSDDELRLITENKYTIEMRPLLFGPAESGTENIKPMHQYLRLFGGKASILEYFKQ